MENLHCIKCYNDKILLIIIIIIKLDGYVRLFVDALLQV